MSIEGLHVAAKAIVLRNVGQHMIGATISWDERDSKVTLFYYLDHSPTDEDKEQGELALTELIAEFADIALADIECAHLQGGGVKLRDMDVLIYVSP